MVYGVSHHRHKRLQTEAHLLGSITIKRGSTAIRLGKLSTPEWDPKEHQHHILLKCNLAVAVCIGDKDHIFNFRLGCSGIDHLYGEAELVARDGT